MNMKRIFFAAMMVATLIMLSGCCACRKGKNNLPLIGSKWQLVRLMGQDYNFDEGQFTFSFDDEGRFSGKGACNQIMGSYTLTEQRAMEFESLSSTRMMCPDAAMESELTKVLDRTTHYEIDGDMLLLLSNGEMQAVLQAR